MHYGMMMIARRAAAFGEITADEYQTGCEPANVDTDVSTR